MRWRIHGDRSAWHGPPGRSGRQPTVGVTTGIVVDTIPFMASFFTMGAGSSQTEYGQQPADR